MPERVTNNRKSEFTAALKKCGPSASNGRLRQELKWDEAFYWRVQGTLIKSGDIIPGRGRGGSVRLAAVDSEPTCIDAPTAIEAIPAVATEEITGRRKRERSLYDPLKETMEDTWINRFAFDDVRIEETHSQGS